VDGGERLDNDYRDFAVFSGPLLLDTQIGLLAAPAMPVWSQRPRLAILTIRRAPYRTERHILCDNSLDARIHGRDASPLSMPYTTRYVR